MITKRTKEFNIALFEATSKEPIELFCRKNRVFIVQKKVVKNG